MTSQEKQEKFVAEYAEVVKHLPKAQMDRLGNTLAFIIRYFLAEGARDKDIPIELSKMGSIVLKLVQNNQYGTITVAQCHAVDQVLDGFEESIRYALPAMHNSLNEAANQGLGFGVIGSAAGVALHSTMDTMERVKNLNSTMVAAGTVIDKKVKQLLLDLRRAMALPNPDSIQPKSNEEIRQEILAQQKKFNRALMIPAVIINTIATAFLALMALSLWKDNKVVIIAPIMVTLSAVLSIPGIGKLIFRKKYGFLQRILRWVIIFVIFVVGFGFAV